MITEDKITEFFCMADDFCKVFDAQMKKYTIQPQNKRKYHRDSTFSKSEVMVIIEANIEYVTGIVVVGQKRFICFWKSQAERKSVFRAGVRT